MRFLLVLTSLCLGACTHLPSIKIGKDRVAAPRDAGSPATLNKDEVKTTLDVPADTIVTTTQVAAVPATASTPFLPARTTTEWRFLQPTKFEQLATGLLASTGTVDTTVAKHRIEAEERRPLLYCAIIATVAGLGFMYVRFQAIAVMSFLAAGAFFLAWRMSEISPWVGGLFLVASVAGFAFYKRAEWDKNNDGIPDALQK